LRNLIRDRSASDVAFLFVNNKNHHLFMTFSSFS
jgi:hypothetical protein